MRFLFFIFVFLAGTVRGAFGSSQPAEIIPPTTGAWIEWSAKTDRVVSRTRDREAAYPRAKQLSNGEILLAYHSGEAAGAYGASITLRRSRDGGSSWYESRIIERPEKRFWGFSNPDFVEMGAGRILLVSAARGKASPNAEDDFYSECAHSGLRLRTSDDYGATWSEGRLVAAGRGRVWEPSLVRTPDGVIELYYANEAPELAQENLTQRIEVIRSRDGGRTWSKPFTVTQDRNCRNGMPAALALRDGSVACAQEVVGRPGSPWIAIMRAGHRIRYQLAQARHGFGSSPYLAQGPAGGVLLGYPSLEAKQPAPSYAPVPFWMFQRIYVQHGDARAENFGPVTLPWTNLAANTGAFFPSLLVKRDGVVVALASFITVRPHGPNRTVVRWIEGRLVGPVRGIQ